MKKGQNEFAISSDQKVRIKVIKEKCISAGTCIVYAADTFDLDEDGISYVKEGIWDELEKIVMAAKSCPTMAIIVEDMDGKQLWPLE
ncbi:hypothetical protein A3K34_03070 [candidate division WWE3 bacterium RIFOXYC1_FULL_40_10]|uniref:Ferredoxin n=1 Tax=candidate division WWE3 bacterium RIFOXYA2_FULL_46_9 TaxID=1802636 RepID=A0A1F4W092_UNCKA|nr:MAG: hypothetical protein A3K58_03070 [candidate division WWE3 bacterium RIFOXYB1_FULL_40_22]OGC61829.1 MAG: hypothetical protein A3K37_03070 [candidate division WWE3 bacterium RIFOXYA1_FULL_40_11]OGC62846.1 MAG: hypothetical protein A2264_04230 [candidate division WWE3 bacterium RIFOXYA2_FULL_46_9]OGC64301.1 MAG: hypothetical protein A2326_00485 [candidate division WWE3 bacterium RIFOXYB2_FULL_41_6]OGC66212.1 MAG: hypothetical protein A3K34_03070 [candidate division WWE3 bacterium RIFOXYC1_